MEYDYLLSFRFTGESYHELGDDLRKVVPALESTGKKVYCSYFDDSLRFLPTPEIYERCATIQRTCKGIILLVRNELPSKGMMYEFKDALELEQEIIQFVQMGIKETPYDGKVHESISYSTIDHLCDTIKLRFG